MPRESGADRIIGYLLEHGTATGSEMALALELMISPHISRLLSDGVIKLAPLQKVEGGKRCARTRTYVLADARAHDSPRCVQVKAAGLAMPKLSADALAWANPFARQKDRGH